MIRNKISQKLDSAPRNSLRFKIGSTLSKDLISRKKTPVYESDDTIDLQSYSLNEQGDKEHNPYTNEELNKIIDNEALVEQLLTEEEEEYIEINNLEQNNKIKHENNDDDKIDNDNIKEKDEECIDNPIIDNDSNDEEKIIDNIENNIKDINNDTVIENEEENDENEQNNEEDDDEMYNEAIVLWGTAIRSLSKNKSTDFDIHANKPGKYALEFRKLDKFVSRVLNIKVEILRNNKILTSGIGGLGGMKWTKRHYMEFNLLKPSDIHIFAQCSSLTSFGSVKFTAALYYIGPLDKDKNNKQNKEIKEKKENKEKEEENEKEVKNELEEQNDYQNNNVTDDFIGKVSKDNIIKKSNNIIDTTPLIVWQLPKTSVSKNQQYTEEFILEEGSYQLLFKKLDKFKFRSMYIDVILSRKGNIISKRTGGLGGIRYSNRYCMEISITTKTRVKINIKCTNATTIGTLDFDVTCLNVPHIKGKAIEEIDTLPRVENIDDITEEINTNEVFTDIEEGIFSGKKVINHTLTAGHYYIGVRNDDTRVGADYRVFSVDLTISQLQSREVLLQDNCEALKKEDLPYRKNFEITEEQEPVICSLTLKTASRLEGKASIKISRTPDPKSFPEIMKRTKDKQFKIAYILVILLLLSYGSQIISFIFALHIGSISVRGVLTIITSIYCFYHRHEMISILKNLAFIIKDKLSFFKGLDELETGLQKIKYLQERSKKKRIALLERKKKEREL